MANIDLSNLTRYDGKIKEYAEDKYLSKNTANWQMTEKAGAVTCYPVPDTELEPIVDFSFKEILPTSGDKSSSNPSTIEGVSNIYIKQYGKNTLTGLTSGTGWSRDANGVYTITDTGSENLVIWLYPFGNNPIPAGTYTFSLNNPTPLPNVRISLRNSEGGWGTSNGVFGRDSYATTANYTVKIIIPENQDYLSNCRILISAVAGVFNTTIRPQFECGNTGTDYDKSPIVLNYTYSLGNTYYGGSVNLATGMMTVTHGKYEIQGTEWWSSAGNDGYTLDAYNSTTGIGWSYFVLGTYGLAPSVRANSVQDPNIAKCSHFNLNPHGYGVGTTSINNGQITKPMMFASGTQYRFAFPYSTLTDWKAYLTAQKEAGTPVTIVYELANPYVVQLDSIQIKSLTALDKNTPRLNTLYTDADSIQVGYQKHPARTAYELENAILALGGGE